MNARVAGIGHARNTDPQIGDWLNAIDPTGRDDAAKANIREARRSYDRANKLPAKLAEDLSRLTSLAQGVWASARKADNFAEFAPTLTEILNLKREEAACLQQDGGDLYDALLDGFEPGMSTENLTNILGKLRPALVALRGKIENSSFQPKPLTGRFDEAKQMEMARRLATVFNYDWDAGRMDRSVHPFSSGYRSDSRVTTRVNPENVFDCLYSAIHEVGHANYENGRDPAMDRTPAGGHASMGIHESQSRMLENQIGRSRAFMDWLYPQMVDVFGDIGVDGPDELFAVVNRVESGFIRTESDEVHYNLHVLMRFDLEQQLISGDLEVADLEEAWNDRFFADFGRKIDRASNGVLQDIHWAVGLFGYFPTYSLGNMYAAELFAAMGKTLPDRDHCIARGELSPLSNWLEDNIHRKGNVYPARDLMRQACGKEADEHALVEYLNQKFGGLYGF
ncbi:MAG: carboxypeptidase M32 [Mariprofundaceae bacterium]|nr:carboxypeptidase M32 [Mariprofundaceae bacterium]